MQYDRFNRRRSSIRLRGYDYTRSGVYFVTICARDRGAPSGECDGRGVVLNEVGRVVAESWLWLEQRHPYVSIDAWIVMPDHLHGLIVLDEVGPRKPLGRLNGAFKTVSTKTVNQLLSSPGTPLWQRGFYDLVVRSEESLVRIRRYIVNNPVRHAWRRDQSVPTPL